MNAVQFSSLFCTLALANTLCAANPADVDAKVTSNAQQAVLSALQSEAAGDLVARDRLLNEAAIADENYAPAQWQRGFIKLANGNWQSVEKCLSEIPSETELAGYESLRLRAPNSAAGQWDLALWCVRNRLRDQSRAHAQRTLQLDADHVGARQLLGFQRVSGQWVTAEQMQQFRLRTQAVNNALDKYGRQLTEMARAFRAHKEQARADAKEQLMKINDVAAIAPVEAIIGSINLDAADATLQWLSTIDDPDSTMAMVRIALFHPMGEVQQRAVLQLKQRPLHDYVPELLQLLSSPVAALSVPVIGPNGTLAGFRQAFAQERQGQTDLIVLDTQLVVGSSRANVRAAVANDPNAAANSRATTVEAIQRSNEQANQNSAAAQADNAAIVLRNRRIAKLLSEVANQEFGGEPREIWTWWDSVNETEHQSAKLPKVRYASARLASRDYSELAALNSALASASTSFVSNECFARGTLVATRKGMKAIETLRVGDLVLSRNIASGELSWRSIVQTTIRPPRIVYDIFIDGEKLRCTGGHLFWVSGKGWAKASQLEPGDVLHAASQPVVVMKVGKLPEEQTYNLAVDRTQTYFVGKQLVLTHDVTDRQPTHYKVPGLSPTHVEHAER